MYITWCLYGGSFHIKAKLEVKRDDYNNNYYIIIIRARGLNARGSFRCRVSILLYSSSYGAYVIYIPLYYYIVAHDRRVTYNNNIFYNGTCAPPCRPVTVVSQNSKERPRWHAPTHQKSKNKIKHGKTRGNKKKKPTCAWDVFKWFEVLEFSVSRANESFEWNRKYAFGRKLQRGNR